MKRAIECCCTNLFEAQEAQQGGAARVELCSNLPIGGITPPLQLITEVISNIKIPVNILIRSRGGNFVYTDSEINLMQEQIREIKCSKVGNKVNGFVIGALNKDGAIDKVAVSSLISTIRESESKEYCNRKYHITFHRAFDEAADPFKALEEIIGLGCDTLLTSGQESSALRGKGLIAELVKKAGKRICIMPGCGVRVENILDIEKCTQAQIFHSSAHGTNGTTDRNIVRLLTNRL